MLIEFQDYLTFENIYLWTNFGVLPFWLMLIFIPSSKFTQFFVNSIILPLLLTTMYVYIIYQAFLLDENMLDFFMIFLSIDDVYTAFATESFLIAFWVHFIALNLFLGSWISRDAVKYNISRSLAFVPLLVVYFTGPIGLVLYWIIRVFYAKKLGLHD